MPGWVSAERGRLDNGLAVRGHGDRIGRSGYEEPAGIMSVLASTVSSMRYHMTNPSPKPLKTTLEQISRETWKLLRDARNFGGSFGEEALTDLLAIGIKRHGFPMIFVEQTTKRKEAKSGTDIEVWLGSNITGWDRLAIQAKKLNPRSGVYKMLEHKHALRQLAMLENYARGRAVPLYFLYNYRDSPDRNHWQCYRPFKAKQLGCTIALSAIIRNAIDLGNSTFDYIHQDLCVTPLRCLATCPNLCLLENPPASTHYRSLPDFLSIASEREPTSVTADEIDPEYYDQDVGLPKRIVVLNNSFGRDDPDER